MTPKETIHLFYACDDAFVKFTAVSLHSIMKNADRERKYHVHVLYTDIAEETKARVLGMADECFEISFDNVSRYLDNLCRRLPLRDYYSNTTYYRMFIADMFPAIDKAIYVDSDTVVQGNIAELYAHDVEQYDLAACHEQAMVQVDVYGSYVEKCLGLDRNLFFNAGVLLINCRRFRERRILERFADLLGVYDCRVTQDEDYLNVLCKDKVLWVEQQWNTEMFGEIPYPEEEYKLIHYIMVSKPWHYADCRCGAFFWEYAKQTFAYEEIKEVLENYTDEEKERDLVSAKRLMQTAIYEINKKDNYLSIVKNGTTKSRERLLIVDKIAKYEREGRFDEDVEEDPPSKELLPEHVDYLRSSVKSKLKSKFAYSVARIFMNDMIAKKQLIIKDIKGLENYAGLQSGAVVTCNHFNAMDSFAMQIVYEASGQKKRKFYRVIREGNYTNFPGFYGMLMRNCNTFPLSSNKQTMRKFMKSVDAILTGGHFLLIYPEQSMWWNYRKPKPLKKGGFIMATKNNVPVLPCFITMEDSDVKDGDGFFVQEYTIHIGKPIYPDAKKKRSENVQAMMDENFACWKNIYERTYGIPLQYADEEIHLPKKA